MGTVGIGGGGDEGTGFDATFALDRIETEEIWSDMFERREVVRRMSGACAYLIVGKSPSSRQRRRFSTAQ